MIKTLIYRFTMIIFREILISESISTLPVSWLKWDANTTTEWDKPQNVSTKLEHSLTISVKYISAFFLFFLIFFLPKWEVFSHLFWFSEVIFTNLKFSLFCKGVNKATYFYVYLYKVNWKITTIKVDFYKKKSILVYYWKLTLVIWNKING